MKITKTNKKVIIDGCGITTIKIPKDIIEQKQIGIWLVDRLGFSKYKQGCITNFTFIGQEENNNGWIKIESEEQFDLIPNGDYFWYDEIHGYYENGDIPSYKKYTHYQPIEKPKPPIY